MSEKLYQALDSITDGLPAFMEVGADETWRREGHPAFILTTLRLDRLMFGYGLEANGPDPIYLVKVDHCAKKARLILIDTPSGYMRLSDANAEVKNASLTLATAMLENARHLRQAGDVDIERHFHLADQEAA